MTTSQMHTVVRLVFFLVSLFFDYYFKYANFRIIHTIRRLFVQNQNVTSNLHYLLVYVQPHSNYLSITRKIYFTFTFRLQFCRSCFRDTKMLQFINVSSPILQHWRQNNETYKAWRILRRQQSLKRIGKGLGRDRSGRGIAEKKVSCDIVDERGVE